MIFENINYFEEQKKRIEITKEEFSTFLDSIPKLDVDFDEFDMCEDPMGGFIQEIKNVLLYSYNDKYTHQLVIKRGPRRTDSPVRIWQVDGLVYIILKEREKNNENKFSQ
jgi:hypothetical protein